MTSQRFPCIIDDQSFFFKLLICSAASNNHSRASYLCCSRLSAHCTLHTDHKFTMQQAAGGAVLQLFFRSQISVHQVFKIVHKREYFFFFKALQSKKVASLLSHGNQIQYRVVFLHAVSSLEVQELKSKENGGWHIRNAFSTLLYNFLEIFICTLIYGRRKDACRSV